MKLLILGGTRFLGRHLVEAALARGHDVTIFTRGRMPVPWQQRVTALTGDRDPKIAPGLAALEGLDFDAAVDCSGYVPRVVEASARLLASRVARYLFVSSLSVYADVSRPGLDERTPVATLADPATEDILPNYGALKAACETAVAHVFGTRATQVRPGLIVGSFDATDRFGYWVARFVQPALLGDRASRAVVPAPPGRPLQFIDARDLAAFILDLAERDMPGTFNACSARGQWTMGDLVDTLCAVAPAPPAPAWIDEATLVAADVAPWVGLPLWLPASEPDSAGFMEMDCSRAEAAGLATRPLRETVADAAAWLASRDNTGAWKQVLGAQAERRILGAAA
ncbi:MAG TPA: NAD-dependent epimerase/dehydratase family protein [Casimicrobiaceae bacterium]|nr:NAD-dependent epimerase/dehydratase family protein [Casimicrobiaceae bacterium]